MSDAIVDNPIVSPSSSPRVSGKVIKMTPRTITVEDVQKAEDEMAGALAAAILAHLATVPVSVSHKTIRLIVASIPLGGK